MDTTQFTDDIDDNKDPITTKEEGRTVADYSNQGLTVVPSTLFKKKYITKLDISDNNIRSLPIDIANLSNLKHLNLSRNGFRCTNPDDTSTIPREIKKIRGLEYLNISECNLSFIPSSIWEIVSLNYLDISRNKINELPANVGNLDELIWLNAQHTGLRAVPDEIVGCVKLETLLLYGNKITTLPYILAEIQNLKTFSINLRHMADQVDSNMESLLQSGQIKSDHISNTIFTLPSVEKIELEYCKINFVHRFHSRHLTQLLLSGNLFREIPDCLLELEELETLDLTNNQLKSINDDIIKLKNLRIFMLSKNKLENVCSDLFEMTSLELLDLSHNCLKQLVLPNTFQNVSLKRLNLSHNTIESLPETITNLESLEDLELTNNHIKELPVDLCSMRNITRIHQYDGLYKVGLWLLNNPIVFPPSTIWNTTDIHNVYSYLEKTKIQRVNKRDPIRIVLLGDNNFHKSDFLSKFLNKTMPKDLQFMFIDRWTSANSIPFIIINVDSNPIYSLIWRYFIDDNSLIWLFIDPDRSNLIDQLNKYIGIVTDSAIDCVIQVIVPEKVIQNENKEDKAEEKKDAEEDDDQGSSIDDILSEATEKYRNCKVRILSDVFILAQNDALATLDQYKSQLEYQAIDKTMFIDDERLEIVKENVFAIEKSLKSKKVVHLNLETIVAEMKDLLNIDDTIVRLCLAQLHKQGKIFWFRNSDTLSSKIYPFIRTFLKSIVSLIRPDYADEMDFDKNPLLRADGLMSVEIVDDMKNNFYNYGEISLPLYKILTFTQSKLLSLKDFLVDANMAWTLHIPSVPDKDSFTRPYTVLPQLNRVQVDSEYFLDNVLLRTKDTIVNLALSVEHCSSNNFDDVFISLCCAINCWAVTRFDWSNLCYVIHDDGDIVIYKRERQNGKVILDIISRSWSSMEVKFESWLTEWFKFESNTRHNSTISMKDVILEELRSPIMDCL